MHRVRQWAHNTAHESKYNPWHVALETAKPPDRVLTPTRSPLAQSNGNDVGTDASHVPSAEPDKNKPKVPIVRRVWLNVQRALFHSWINVLLVFVPAGIAVHFAGVNPNVVFALNAIAIIPLAALLTYATESVAHRLGPTLGALLNVSFGNAVELIIFIALVNNQIRIVQASLVGSILANLLLILGMAFLVGGLEYREQVYDSTVTQMSACLLALAVLSLLIPTAFHASFNDLALADAAVLKLSRGTSVILLITYVLYLLFQLKSHAYLYQGTPQHIIDEQSQPGLLARFDSSSTSSRSSIASGRSTQSSLTSAGSHRKVRNRLRAKLGRKRHTKTEFADEVTDEPEEIVQDEKNQVGTSLNSAAAENHPLPISETAVPTESISTIRNQEKRDEVADLRTPRVRANRPQIVTRFTTPATMDNNETIPTSAATEPNRPTATLRTFSSFRVPPVFRSSTNPQSITHSNSLPPHQLRRLASTPNAPGRHPSTSAHQPSRSGTNATDSIIDEPPLSQTASIILLLCSTALVALCAEFLVGSIEHLVESTSLSEAFIGLIILPIVGNAAEHVTAVTVAAKNKLDLSLGVSLGSSIQIALFVTPIVCLLGWALDKQMGLYFNLFETASLFVSTFIVNFLVLDGRSNYLEGALLCATYIILAVAAFFFPDGQLQSALAAGSGAGTT